MPHSGLTKSSYENYLIEVYGCFMLRIDAFWRNGKARKANEMITYSDPLVLDDVIDVESLLGVRLEHAADEIFRVFRYVLPFRIRKLVLEQKIEQHGAKLLITQMNILSAANGRRT